ncbi:MAG: uncharacterized protein QOJ42_835, partial [Acidobacteriaceae bacterium]|nr:uncharacterized protein [Acidobacteriaceae bacterium]
MLVQLHQNHELFLNLNEDSILKPFRQLSGQPAPGEDLGGWYSPSSLFDPPKNMTGYIPAWAGSKTKATVNGKAVDATLTPGTWANIDRTWKDSDRVELSLACVSASPPSTTATRSSSLS